MDKMHDKENNPGSLIKAFVKMMSVHGAFDEEKNSKSGSISPPASQSSRALLRDTNVKFIANSRNLDAELDKKEEEISDLIIENDDLKIALNAEREKNSKLEKGLDVDNCNLQNQVDKLKQQLEKSKTLHDKEIGEFRHKLEILVKENDDLRGKVLELENKDDNRDKIIGRYKSNGSANGRIVFKGSKGGKYYLTKKGTKSYLRQGDVIEPLDSEEEQDLF